MPRPIKALIALFAIALLAAGCGGDDGGGGNESFDAQEELDRAFSEEGIGALDSGVLDLNFDLGVEGDQSGTFNLSLTGPFNQDGETDLALDVTGGGEGESVDFSGELITTTDNLYVGFNDNVYELGSDRYQTLKDSSGGGTAAVNPADFQEACRTGLRASGADPSACDELSLSSWLTTPTDEGQEEVAGADTNHVAATIDTRELFTDVFGFAQAVVPAGQTPPGVDLASFADQAAEFFDSATIDVFVGDEDGIPRRADFAIDGDVLGNQVNIDFGFEVSGVNEEQTVEAPADAQPIENLRDEAPAQFQPLIDCFLDAQSAQELQGCSQSAVPSVPGAGASTGL